MMKNATQLQSVGVSKAYDGFSIKNIEIAVAGGEILALLGQSGCGKSTLLKCLAQVVTPDAGSIQIGQTTVEYAGGKVKQQHGPSLSGKVGLVFQQHNLWPHMSVLQNMILAPMKVLKHKRAQAIEQAMHWLSHFGLQDKAPFYPSQLSGGQQQRVAILRAMLMQPEVLLLDEPTASLDPHSVASVLKVVKELASQGVSIVIATHEIEVAKKLAQQVCFMEAGKVIENDSAAILHTPKSPQLAAFLTTHNVNYEECVL